MSKATMRGAQPSAGPAASPSAGALPPAAGEAMERLLSLQKTLAEGEQPVTNDSPTGATTAPPAGEEEPVTPAPGEGGDAGELPGDGQTDLSQGAEEGTEVPPEGGAPEGALPAELAELPEDVREQLIAIAGEVRDGTTDFGTIKRGHKLIAQHAAEVERLNGEIDSLQQKLAQAEDGRGLPTAATSGLKSVKEVKERELRLRKLIDWCDDNPDGGEQNGQEFTAEDVKSARRAARNELNYDLPEVKEKLQQQEQQQAVFTKQQQAARVEVFKQFPMLKDAENAETQKVQEMLTKVPMLKTMFVSPEMAALTWIRGEAALRAELAKRSPAKPMQNAKGKMQNAVAAKRPASGGTAAGARPSGGPTVASAKSRIEKERSVGALADLMSATKA